MNSMATRISSKLVFTGRVFRVERDRVTLPHGRVVTMDVVRHRGSVVLVPQPSPRDVILIRQYRYVIDRWIWELPAGSLEEGESPLRAARRECVEEIGLRPAVVERLGEYVPTPGFCDERMVFYRCAQLAPPRRRGPLDPDEQIEPKVFTLRQTWDLVRRGEIVDMKTILGLGMISGKVPVQRRRT
jgi:ADP-ribose pyrophosphatase